MHFIITGFGTFGGVNINPTQVLVESLTRYIENHPLPSNEMISFECIPAFEVSMGHVNEALPELITSSIKRRSIEPVTFLLLGVSSEQTGFCLERYAYNEATFRIPDQRGCRPVNEKIIDNSTTSLPTTLPLELVSNELSSKGFGVSISTDPGRFLCNYLYYHCLHYSYNNTCPLLTDSPFVPSSSNCHALFVHVPPFEAVPEETQLQFIRELVVSLANTVNQK